MACKTFVRRLLKQNERINLECNASHDENMARQNLHKGRCMMAYYFRMVRA